jgi:hypothetical protein
MIALGSFVELDGDKVNAGQITKRFMVLLADKEPACIWYAAALVAVDIAVHTAHSCVGAAGGTSHHLGGGWNWRSAL